MGRILLVLTLAALALLPGRASAQHEYSIWYFGQGFGLDFRGGAPVLLSEGAIWTSEGSATICDRHAGALLFYTDGVTIFDRSHAAMANGRELNGHASSTQSALIVPMPGDPAKYYVFTTDQEGYDGPNRGAFYSVVDMTLNGRRGEVTRKNVPLLAHCSEKLTAVPHANGLDYWVLLHGLGGNSFYAYQVGIDGIAPNPVVSIAGRTQSGPPGETVWNVGYLKASPDGRRLAGVCQASGLVELFDFDPCTGTVSDPIRLDIGTPDAPYGITFSPDGRKLYVAAGRSLLQYDLTRYERASIIASRTRIIDTANRGIAEVGGAMQIGPDGRIYTVVDGNWIGIIEHPNAAGQGCGYRTRGIRVTDAFGVYWLGLPNNIDAVRSGRGTIPVAIAPAGPIDLCEGGSLTLDAGPGYSTYRWSTGDTTRTIIVTSAGGYSVTVAGAGGCGSATMSVRTATPPRPRLHPGDTVHLCAGESVLLEAPEGYRSYRWSTGEDVPAITVGAPGSYSVSVADDNGCSGTSPATVVVLHPPAPVPTIARTATTLLSTPAAAYQWLRDGEPVAGATERALSSPVPGTYRVAIVDTNGCRAVSAPLAVEPPRRPHVVWIDTVSAVVGQRVRLRLRIDPPLAESDSALGFRAVIRMTPSALWVHGACEGTTIAGSAREGMFVAERPSSAAPMQGNILTWIEVEGLVTGDPLDPVAIDSIALSHVAAAIPVTIAGPGLVVLSGCSIGRGASFGEGLKIMAVTPLPVRDRATLRYLAPVGSIPTMAMSDVAGREIAYRRLPPGTGDEQETRLDLGHLPAGVYFVALRIPAGGSVLPIVISR